MIVPLMTAGARVPMILEEGHKSQLSRDKRKLT